MVNGSVHTKMFAQKKYINCCSKRYFLSLLQ